ncbi:MAG: hypothetical protein KAH03_06255 [Cocleimonas sp.]|nr:hypothetical protein [Cocleimonas sp.]
MPQIKQEVQYVFTGESSSLKKSVSDVNREMDETAKSTGLFKNALIESVSAIASIASGFALASKASAKIAKRDAFAESIGFDAASVTRLQRGTKVVSADLESMVDKINRLAQDSKSLEGVRLPDSLAESLKLSADNSEAFSIGLKAVIEEADNLSSQDLSVALFDASLTKDQAKSLLVLKDGVNSLAEEAKFELLKEKSEKFKEALARLTEPVNLGFKESIDNALLEPMTRLADTLANAKDSTVGFFKNFGAGIKDFINNSEGADTAIKILSLDNISVKGIKADAAERQKLIDIKVKELQLAKDLSEAQIQGANALAQRTGLTITQMRELADTQIRTFEFGNFTEFDRASQDASESYRTFLESYNEANNSISPVEQLKLAQQAWGDYDLALSKRRDDDLSKIKDHYDEITDAREKAFSRQLTSDNTGFDKDIAALNKKYGLEEKETEKKSLRERKYDDELERIQQRRADNEAFLRRKRAVAETEANAQRLTDEKDANEGIAQELKNIGLALSTLEQNASEKIDIRVGLLIDAESEIKSIRDEANTQLAALNEQEQLKIDAELKIKAGAAKKLGDEIEEFYKTNKVNIQAELKVNSIQNTDGSRDLDLSSIALGAT